MPTPVIERLEAVVDTHAHLDDERLASDLGNVLARAADAGVRHVVAVGTTADSSAETLALATRWPGVFAAVGIQPNHVAEAVPGDWERVETMARSGSDRVVALGETGLDRYWDRAPFDWQQDYFARHLALADELGLPVIIHCRNCESDLVDQMKALGRPISGVLHSFTGDVGQARDFLDLGLHVSFAGMVTFANNSLDSLRAAAAYVPLDRLLVETDSPYLSPHPFRGRTNEPARVAITARHLAGLRGIDPADLAAATTENAVRLFRLSPEWRLGTSATSN